MSDEIIAEIAERTDGVPLFVEELTKSVLESGVALRGDHRRYPARLLMAGSTAWNPSDGWHRIGSRDWTGVFLDAVARCFPSPEDELQTALSGLVASELIFQRGAPPDAVYSFKHALVQDAAHGSLLRSTRQRWHARIAEALEAQSPDLTDTQPELLASTMQKLG